MSLSQWGPDWRCAPSGVTLQGRRPRAAGFLAEAALTEDDTAWSPTLTPADCRKLDEVRLALRRRDLPAAARHARLFAMKQIA
jgi:hypothetical protein